MILILPMKPFGLQQHLFAGYRKCHCTTNVNIWQFARVQFRHGIQVTNVPSVQQWMWKVFKRWETKLKEFSPVRPVCDKASLFHDEHDRWNSNVEKIWTTHLRHRFLSSFYFNVNNTCERFQIDSSAFTNFAQNI